MPIEIKKYKSEVSGILYDTIADAEKDEKRNNLKNDIAKYYMKHRLPSFAPNDIADWIVTHWDELVKLVEARKAKDKIIK